MTPEFMLTTLIVVASPGAGALFTIAAGIARGWRASLVAAFACTLGIVPHVIAAVTGLAAIMHASALAFSIVKWFGVAYLLYLAWKTFRDQSMFDVETGTAQTSTVRVIGSGVLVNTLNPKLTIFFFAFLPQFVAPGSADAVASMIWLSAIFMAVTLVVFSAYGVFAAALRRQVISRPRVVSWIRRSFGATYLVLAGRLAVQSR
ncbi:lysine transporter LysE [Mycolicibacterium arabiense]|uniref:Lysine transporter LysE n=1 Tax=Mycolicibacterium arabiense TaxID=1286181 RepID=A0A7I7S2H0_9MYCO|nr:LysE family translocator [Mycolicibacterium arabiense]MCV7371917.1 LysE family translocator [Mycolicibacterium arabiense]BBY50630.1 lysine transporter LysE [Mycolicibacterium arabiense]